MTGLLSRGRIVTSRPLQLSLLLATLLSAGCQTPTPVEAPPEPEPVPVAVPEVEPPPPVVLSDRELQRLALEHLQEGEPEQALEVLKTFRESVGNRRMADQLIRQIETPIEDYFPEESFVITLSEGESLSIVAKRYLGDALEFFALARYNNLDRPAQVERGQQIRIPATERAASVFAQPREKKTAPVVSSDIRPNSESAAALRAAAKDPVAEKLAASQRREADGDLHGAYTLAREASEIQADNAAAQTWLATLSPRVVEAHYREAVSAFSRQDLDATIEHANAALAIEPGHTNAQVYKVRAEELRAKLQELDSNR